MIIKRKYFSKSEEGTKKEGGGHKNSHSNTYKYTTLSGMGGSVGALIGNEVGKYKGNKLFDEALAKARRANSLAEKFNQRLAGIEGRRISPEGIEYLNTIKKGIEKEGEKAIKLANKSKSLPAIGMIIGGASGSALGYGAGKLILMKKNKKKKNK